MITPTIGRQVWYWQHQPSDVFERNPQPQAATVCFVHSDRMVNLQVIGHSGVARAQSSVPLRQPEDETPLSHYCEWMPYQKAVASGQQEPTRHEQPALATGATS